MKKLLAKLERVNYWAMTIACILFCVGALVESKEVLAVSISLAFGSVSFIIIKEIYK